MRTLTIVGVGALGSHAAMLLRNEDVRIKVIDFDRVEQKNVASQFHTKPNVGKNKTQALQQTMNFMFGVKIETVPHRLTKENYRELLGGSFMVLDCLDNAASRRIIKDAVAELKIPCLHAAIDGNGSFGRVVWSEQFSIDEEDGAGVATCENGEHLAFIGIVSSHVSYAVHAFLAKNSHKLNYSISPAGSMKF